MIVEYDEYSMASDIGYMSRNDKKNYYILELQMHHLV